MDGCSEWHPIMWVVIQKYPLQQCGLPSMQLDQIMLDNKKKKQWNSFLKSSMQREQDTHMLLRWWLTAFTSEPTLFTKYTKTVKPRGLKIMSWKFPKKVQHSNSGYSYQQIIFITLWIWFIQAHREQKLQFMVTWFGGVFASWIIPIPTCIVIPVVFHSQSATQPDSTLCIQIVFIDFACARTNEQCRGVLFCALWNLNIVFNE